MSSTINNKSALSPEQLTEDLTMLNQSLKGIIPIITSQHVDAILKLTITSSALAWNWSKSFNYQHK